MHTVINFIIFIYSATVLAGINATDFVECGCGKPPISLDVKNCKETPCKFPRGQNATMKMNFEVDHDVNSLTASVRAHVLGTVVPYPLPQPNACLGLINAECPLDKGEEPTYELQMPVLESFPKLKVLIEFYLKDENKNVIVCFKLSAQVVDG